MSRGDVVLEHCTIIDNSSHHPTAANNPADAIYVENGQTRLRIKNCILWNPTGCRRPRNRRHNLTDYIDK